MALYKKQIIIIIIIVIIQAIEIAKVKVFPLPTGSVTLDNFKRFYLLA